MQEYNESMKRNKNLYYAIGLCILIAFTAYVIVKPNGLYYKFWFTDVVLHIVAGSMFAYFWLWLMRNAEGTPKWLRFSAAILFAVFGSVVWEMWELLGYKLTPWLTRDYIPELPDSLSDIVCGMFGGILASLSLFKKRN